MGVSVTTARNRRMMRRTATLAAAVSLSLAAQASVFGDYRRGDDAPDQYPERLQLARFDDARVDDRACPWHNAGRGVCPQDRSRQYRPVQLLDRTASG